MPHPNASLPGTPLQRGPAHVRCLEVFVTNQCNMACVNCCVAIAQAPAEIKRLEWEDLKPALDAFMDPGQVPYPGRKTVVFAGGETFMNYPLVQRAVDHLAALPAPPHVEVYTNGTLVKREWAAALLERGAKIIFSLDGGKEGNDLYRAFVNEPARSTWDAALSRLQGLPLGSLATNTILHPGNLKGLVKALDHFSRLGFPQIDLWLDYLHLWTPQELDALKAFVAEFSDYYARRAEAEGALPFLVPMMKHALHNGTQLAQGKTWWKDCFRLVLGADGRYYDCEGALLVPYERIAESNSVNRARDGQGVDWAARQAYMDEADLYLERLGADKDWQDVCPRMYYKALGLMGQDCRHMVENLHRTSRVFLVGLVTLARRLEGHPAFRDAYLEPAPALPG